MLSTTEEVSGILFQSVGILELPLRLIDNLEIFSSSANALLSPVWYGVAVRYFPARHL